MKNTALSLLSLGVMLFTASCKDETKSESSLSEETTEVVYMRTTVEENAGVIEKEILAENQDVVNNEAIEETQCNKEEKKTKDNDQVNKSDMDVPNFDNEQVQEFANTYAKYVEEYKIAVENGDSKALALWAEKGKGDEFRQGFVIAMKNLSGDEQKKFYSFFDKKTAQMFDLGKDRGGVN